MSFLRVPSRLFFWWRQELAACVPDFLRKIFRRPGEAIVFETIGQEIKISRESHDRKTDLLAVPAVHGVDAGRDSPVRREVERLCSRRRRIELRLPSSAILRKSLRLPSSARQELDQLLIFQIDQETPFRPEDVLIDHFVSKSEDRDGNIEVDVAILPKYLFDESVERLAALGVVPTAAGTGEYWDRDGRRIEFLATRHSGFGATSRTSVVLGAFLLVLSGALGTVVAERQSLRQSDQLELLQTAKREAHDVAGLEARLQTLIESRNAPDRLKRKSTPMSTVLQQLTHAVPDGSWLTQFDAREDTLRISGYSTSASTLVPRIESSASFREVRFRSKVSRDGRIGREHFQLEIKIGGDSP